MGRLRSSAVLACLVVALCALHLDARAEMPPPTLAVQVDPRVELFSLIFRLAGAPEYNACRVPGYQADLDRTFAPYKTHPAVRLAQQLREEHGIAFDAVMKLAIAVTDPPALDARTSFGPSTLDERWRGRDASAFVRAARRFARDTRFAQFVAAHQPLYAETTRRLETLANGVPLPWFERFFGQATDATFRLVPALCNGGANYGVKVRPHGGPQELYAIVGVTQTDTNGVPTFDSTLFPTIVHEFAHSFVNPVVERHPELLEPGARVYSRVADKMQMLAYGEPQIMVIESLVRGVVGRAVLANGQGEAAERERTADISRGFVWMEDLDRRLQDYEAQRDRFPRFDDFAPQLVAFFADVAATIDARLAAYDARRPKVVSITPRDGDTAVDPATTRLVVVFDRPMRKSYSLDEGPGGPSHFPQVGKAAFDADRVTFTLEMQLQPATKYEVLFKGFGFRSEDGFPMREQLVRFETGPPPR